MFRSHRIFQALQFLHPFDCFPQLATKLALKFVQLLEAKRIALAGEKAKRHDNRQALKSNELKSEIILTKP